MDLYTLKFFNQTLHGPFATGFFTFASSPYPYVIFGVLLAIVSFRHLSWQRALGMIAMTALVVGLCDVLSTYYFKKTFIAVRPCVVYDWVLQPPKCSGIRSFPSNHAINIASLVGCFLLLCHDIYTKKTLRIIYTLSISAVFIVATSRVYFALHRPSEALMGLIFGFYISWFVFKLFKIRILKA